MTAFVIPAFPSWLRVPYVCIVEQFTTALTGKLSILALKCRDLFQRILLKY